MSLKEHAEFIKEAIALEKHGYNFYTVAAENAKTELSRNLFTQFANDEKEHMEILDRQYKSLMNDGKWAAAERDDAFEIKDLINDLKKQLGGDAFDITAVYVAMNLEEKAEKNYRDRMNATEDPEGKKLLKWLADWERGHFEQLHRLNESMKEDFWYDSNFYPF